jgi:hypothetical protein
MPCGSWKKRRTAMAKGKLKANFPEGTRVTAPHPGWDRDREVCPGVVTDNLSVMYYITFDDGTTGYVFKAEEVRSLEE